ncbi:hypothetical protein HCN44_003620 [Aphidius gifuensis]|uniref:Alpha-N-acetylglucosaminidase n=1 Tax=Aphidius gifuensis TaxID=684658 RepID=A0A834XLF2_APHGI|nr:alpha-N-acetylglucosaminidase [Aphidius gifuensis]KAF7987757.1 hypothetical protein HCN44_003620 [Aphidius gifuensis]
MTGRSILLFILLSFVLNSTAKLKKHDGFEKTLGHLKPKSSADDQQKAAFNLIERIVKNNSKLFSVIVDPTRSPEGKDKFTITKNQLGQIQVLANSGVAAAWGFHYYIKNYCNAHISWEGQQIELPNSLPDVDITVTSKDRFRYYQNVCTVGYSSTWWSWNQWEKNIDWMALNGINFALAFHGQEAIWKKIYLDLKLSQSEIDEHFGGTAFLPWSRMGNIRGWGGPLSESWHEHTINLQHKILTRMRQLGIIPILPAFAGHVPQAFSRIYQNSNFTKIDCWNDFEDKYCCPLLLSPTDPLFNELGQKFLRTYIDEFGTDHVYNCDTFNENEPPSGELESLKEIGAAVYKAMVDVDPQAIWVMQGWLFVHQVLFWTEPRVEAFVTSVPLGKMIVLDLQSEQFPQYERFKSYYGQPYIWCMLHNFGGTLGLFGSAGIINERVIKARNMNNSTMIGTGLTPEGINQNYVIYELMNEMAYRSKSVNLDDWFENYATRRYGAWNEYASKAWITLGNTVYNFDGIERVRGHYVITKRPSLKIKPWTWYDKEEMLSAWDNLIKARYGRGNSSLYKHDIVDITRQSLQLIADDIYENIVDANNKKNITNLKIYSSMLLEIFDDLENILASSDNFLLGKWINDAKLLGTNDDEKKLYEFNAKNQITLWGPGGEIIDYANKQWSGVMSDYFKARWMVFLEALDKSVSQNLPLQYDEVVEKMFTLVEKPFSSSYKNYPIEPQGNSVDIAVFLNNKWRNRKISSKNRKKLSKLRKNAE